MSCIPTKLIGLEGESVRLSSRVEYGVRAMFELALSHGGDPVSIKTINERQCISESYLEQLFGSLRKSGLVKGIRGNAGGYVLVKDPRDITVGEIVCSLDGPIIPWGCLSDHNCSQHNSCAAQKVWGKLQKSIDDVLDSTTLQDMIDSVNK